MCVLARSVASTCVLPATRYKTRHRIEWTASVCTCCGPRRTCWKNSSLCYFNPIPRTICALASQRKTATSDSKIYFSNQFMYAAMPALSAHERPVMGADTGLCVVALAATRGHHKPWSSGRHRWRAEMATQTLAGSACAAQRPGALGDINLRWI